jgi:hypothetical protein
VVEQQYLGFSPTDGFSTEPQDIGEFQINTMHCRYMIWNTSDNQPIASQRWTTGILPYINSKAGKVYQVNGVTPRPTSWG